MYCPMTKAKTKRYLAKIKEDEFLLVTAQPMTVYSENCAYLKATIQGTYVINVKPNGKGCNLFLDDFELPVRGSIFVNKITCNNTRIPTTFTTKSSLPTTDVSPFSLKWNHYGLPTVLILGLLSTMIGTAVSMYILRYTRGSGVSAANIIRREHEENPPMMELMPMQLRPALRNISFQQQRHDLVDEDSSSG